MLPAAIEDYYRPKSLKEATDLASQYNDGEAIFLAGGQSAMQAIKTRILRPRCIIDLQNLDELRQVDIGKRSAGFGALVRYVDLAEKQDIPPALLALKDACTHVGDRQVRNRGTIGGSLCWNYVAACVPAVFLTLGGEVLLQNSSKKRTIDAEDFFLGPLETIRKEDEILSKVVLPIPKKTGSAYQKWGLVKDALPVVGVAASVTLDRKRRCADCRIGLAGLPSGGQLTGYSKDLIGWQGESSLLENIFEKIAANAEVHADLSASEDYRRLLIKEIGQAVCTTAYQRALTTL